MIDQKTRVLVLCTGNSCRSQMAEAYLRLFASDRLEIASAGTAPASAIHPLTVVVMAEDGIDLGPKRPADYRRHLEAERIDYLITVCDAASADCPTAWPAVRRRLSWSFDDPAAFDGSEEETLAEFRRVRDEIKVRVRQWLTRADRPVPTKLQADAS